MSAKSIKACVFFQTALEFGADLANAYIVTAETFGIDAARLAFFHGEVHSC